MELLANFGSYALAGVIVSLIAQYTKQWLDTKKEKLLFVVFLSILMGAFVYFFNLIPQNAIQIMIGIFASANTVYLVIIRWFNAEQV